jgi:hypothetical protein
MGGGTPLPVTARCGTRGSRRAGVPTPTAGGSGSRPGAGPGWMPSPGDLRRAITGRWASIGESWGWVPGAFEPSPVYAPALVAFLGAPGAGLYVSGAVGPQVGWFPLAPGETYWPSYSADPSYIRTVNRASVGSIDNVQIMRNVMLPAQVADAQFANRRFATVAPQHVFASAGKIDPAAQHVPATAFKHASVTMRPPQIRPAQARAVPGPAALGVRGQPVPVVGTQGEHTGGAGRLPAPSNAVALPPHSGTASAGHQPGQPISTAALPRPGHPGEAPAHSGTAAPPPSQSFTGQHNHPTWSGATHSHAAAQAFHPPAQAPQPPAQAFHAPAPAQALHPPAQSAQQVAHAPQAAKGAGAAPQASKGGGPTPAREGKGDKHD